MLKLTFALKLAINSLLLGDATIVTSAFTLIFQTTFGTKKENVYYKPIGQRPKCSLICRTFKHTHTCKLDVNSFIKSQKIVWTNWKRAGIQSMFLIIQAFFYLLRVLSWYCIAEIIFLNWFDLTKKSWIHNRIVDLMQANMYILLLKEVHAN